MSSDNKEFCKNFATAIWLFQAQELPVKQMQAWEKHLQSCATCATKYQELKSVQQFYQELPAMAMDEATFARQVSRTTLKNDLPQNYRPPVPPLFKKLGAILLPLAAAILIYLRLNPPEIDSNFAWNPPEIQSTVAEIDSAIAALQQDPVWTDASLSQWDQGSADLEYSIDVISQTIDEIQ